MTFDLIKYQVGDRLGRIIINRPEKRNAMNAALVQELKMAFTLAQQDDAVKVIILQAEGKVFSAGADLEYLKQLQENSYEDNLKDSRQLMELYRQIYLHEKIVIAQVEGHAIAGGCGLMTVCDFVYAVPEAKFGYTEAQIGFVPALVSVFLLRKLGETKVRELLLTAKLISAPEAKHMGLINEIFPAAGIADAVTNIATECCFSTSAASVKTIKRLIAETPGQPLDEALETAAVVNAKARDEEDCRRGIDAFLNKEKISW